MESLPSSSSASTTFTQGQLSRDEVQKPMHPSTANYRPPSATVFTPTIQSPPNDTTMDATSATTLSPRHHVRISWGKCGIPGSLKIRRFLETMAEEVAVQEGFQYAKILWVLLTKTLFYFSGWPHCLDLLCTATLIRVPNQTKHIGSGSSVLFLEEMWSKLIYTYYQGTIKAQSIEAQYRGRKIIGRDRRWGKYYTRRSGKRVSSIYIDRVIDHSTAFLFGLGSLLVFANSTCIYKWAPSLWIPIFKSWPRLGLVSTLIL